MQHTPNLWTTGTINNRGGTNFLARKSYFEKNKLKFEIERKECAQLIRKYPLLGTKASKCIDFSMDVCCKMAKLNKFSKT